MSECHPWEFVGGPLDGQSLVILDFDGRRYEVPMYKQNVWQLLANSDSDVAKKSYYLAIYGTLEVADRHWKKLRFQGYEA